MKIFITILATIFIVQGLTLAFALAKAAKRGDEMMEEATKKR